MFESNLKDEIKNRLKISEIISKKITLNKKGENNFLALCPFHNEKTPSFSVQDDKGFYHCFGCGKHGDIFNFVMEIDNLDFKEALKYLSGQAGITYPNSINTSNLKPLKVLEEAKNFFIKRFYHNDGFAARKYLNQRNIDDELCKEFSIGYAPPRNSKPYLIEHLLTQGFSDDDIIKSGLAKKKNENFFGYFHNRIIIPIISKNGNVVGFGGRVLDEGNPKYLNSPENEIFKKRNLLFGVCNLKRTQISKEGLILSEGYMDVISLYKHGFSSVASLGTSVSDNQIEQILNLSDKIFVVFDGDMAGKNATLRVFDKILPLLKLGKIFKFIFLPKGMDPEEFINKNGVLAFKNKLVEGYSITDMIWLMGLKIKNDNQPETIAKVWDFIRNKVRLISNNNLKIAIRDELEKRINQLRFKNKGLIFNYKKNNKLNLKLPNVGLKLRYKSILLFIIYSPELFFILEKEFKEIKFNDIQYENIKEEILKILFTNPNISSIDLINKLHAKGYSEHLDDFNFKNLFSRLLINEDELDTEKCKVLLKELIFMIKKSKIL